MLGYTRTNTPVDIDPKQLIGDHEDEILDHISEIDDIGYFPNDEETLLDTLIEGLSLIKNKYNEGAWDFTALDGSTRQFIAINPNEDDDYDLFIPAEVEVLYILNLISVLPDLGKQLGILGEGIITT